ncbi:PilZ domain-containing protein [Sphingomonas sp. SCN 67-18]|uniref:PilZ domain-containing protein n=1 Tax=uncultured Sphingomonas sp. TaxID=158754 RepID=UPI0025EFA341|nr:PilZ domain-containing protein [Sphingomonas sp. SCN 67-18]
MKDAVTTDEKEQELAQQRGSVRDSMFLQARVRRLERDEEIVARVRNLSAGGMMMETPAQLVRGDRIESEVRGIGLVRGKVAWASEGRVGVAFDSPIDPKAARVPIGRAAAVAPPKPFGGIRRAAFS